MDNSYLVMAAEARRLSELIQTQLAESEAIEAVILIEDREEAGSSSGRSSMMSNGLLLMSPSASRSAVVASTPVRPGSAPPKLQGMMSLTEGWNGSAFPTPATPVGTFFSEGKPRYEDFGVVTEDDDASSMDTANVDEMLKSISPPP
jgi:hypothetical protein